MPPYFVLVFGSTIYFQKSYIICIINASLFINFLVSRTQPKGKGKYVFDIGCEQHGEYIVQEIVSLLILANYHPAYLCRLLE